MTIEEKVKQAQGTKSKRSEDFLRQLNRGQSFKKKMEAAGVARDEKYEIPLMRRIGHPGRN